MFAYVAAVLGHSGYTARYSTELATPGPRVPLTADPDLFTEAARLGRELLWCHCYAERYSDPSAGRPTGDIAPERARVLTPIPMDNVPAQASFDVNQEVIRIGDGAVGPVSDKVWSYEVSGMHVLGKWLGYRRRKPAGRKSSPLDSVVATTWPAEWTSELLALLWILERLIDLEPAQDDLLSRIATGQVVTVSDLERANILPVPPAARERPQRKTAVQVTLLAPLGP